MVGVLLRSLCRGTPVRRSVFLPSILGEQVAQHQLGLRNNHALFDIQDFTLCDEFFDLREIGFEFATTFDTLLGQRELPPELQCPPF